MKTTVYFFPTVVGMVGEGGCRLREAENERQINVARAEKMRSSMVIHGAGKGSRSWNLEHLPYAPAPLDFLRSVPFKVLICNDVRSLRQNVYQHSASFTGNVLLFGEK